MHDKENQTPGTRCGELLIPDETGHTVVAWDTAEPQTVETARERFNLLRSQGYAALRASVDTQHAGGGSATPEGILDAPSLVTAPISEFDETAEHILFLPPVCGG